MTDLGIGSGGLGLSSIGYGEIVPINSVVSKLFRLPEDTTKQGNSAALNTTTGDIIRDPLTGIHMGMSDVHQMVYLAIRTLKYSSSAENFGFDFTAEIIQEATIQKLQDAVRSTLQSLVDQGKIEIVSITVSRFNSNGLSCIVDWRDLFTGKKTPFRFSI